ncbi:MAG: amidase family protein [bacterium]
MPDLIFAYRDASQAAGRGPLSELEILIQPNLAARGWECGAGSVALEKFVPLQDAAAVEKLKAAGAKLAGSIRMAELGLGLDGDRMADALSQSLGHAAVMTDLMGEARCAAVASQCYGFKPSYGLISRFGFNGLIPSMECLGVAARSLDTITTILAVLAGPDERDPSMRRDAALDFTQAKKKPDKPIKAGVIRESLRGLSPDEAKCFEQALTWLGKMNIHVTSIGLPEYELFRVAHQAVGSVEASSHAGKYDGVRYGHRTANAENWNEMYLRSRAESFGLLIKSYLFQGAYFQFQNYPAFDNACRIRGRLLQQAQALFENVDVLISPLRSPASDASGDSSLDKLYDRFEPALPANLLGFPALAVPGSLFDPDMSLGLQWMGPPLADVRLLAAARHLVNAASGKGTNDAE